MATNAGERERKYLVRPVCIPENWAAVHFSLVPQESMDMTPNFSSGRGPNFWGTYRSDSPDFVVQSASSGHQVAPTAAKNHWFGYRFQQNYQPCSRQSHSDEG